MTERRLCIRGDLVDRCYKTRQVGGFIFHHNRKVGRLLGVRRPDAALVFDLACSITKRRQAAALQGGALIQQGLVNKLRQVFSKAFRTLPV